MLPLSLSIEGLYSYEEKQTIDFTKLTESGLFGIFGTVGSGKSTILEAISFALFGDTERLNRTDKRGYNMMNLKSNQTMIVFEFLNFEGKKYRFVAQWKRRKNFEDTSTIERMAYLWEDNNWVPLESADGTRVTNLSYANFRRTIIIPQGKFKEFLELKGKDRSEMMKEIFNLNKFDLGPRVSLLQSENNQKLENIKGALSGFESISIESLGLKKKELEESKSTLEQTKKAHGLLFEKVQIVREISDKKKEHETKKLQYQELEGHRTKIQYQEKELNRYQQTTENFQEPLSRLQSLNSDRESLIHKIEDLQSNKEKRSQEIDIIQKQLENIQIDFLKINNFRKKAEDFKYLILIKEYTLKENESLRRIAKGDPILSKSKANEQQITKNITELENSLKSLKDEKIDTSQLIEMEKWYQQKVNIQKQIDQFTTQLKEILQEQAKYEREFSASGYNLDTWEEKITTELESIDKQIISHRILLTSLSVQSELATYVDSLQDGKPCPLCGALDHPQPMEASHVQTELAKKEQQLRDLENVKKQRHKLKETLAKLAFNVINLKSNSFTIKQNIESGNNTLKNHFESFHWSGFSSDDSSAFEAKKQKIKINEQLINENEHEIAKKRDELKKIQNSISRFEKEIESIRSEIAVAQGIISQNRKALTEIKIEDYNENSLADVKTEKKQLDDYINQIETKFNELTQQVNLKRTSLAEIVGQYNLSKDQLSKFNLQIKTRQEELRKLLLAFKFNDVMEVQQIIQRKLPIEQIRKDIQQFYVRMEVLETQLKSLEEFLTNKTLSEEDLQTTEDLYAFKKEELELQLSLTGALEKELSFMTIEFGKKEKLLESLASLSNRATNLKTLENLFKGNGFVNYISSIHLHQMCEMANFRFHRLTKNQLSLAINESNEFEVIDYLNDGHRRSVKTLSGGQSFQASLCLALALAENIQSLNKSDKNFFFIDEGFGTQDAESINTVFDTLQYLHRENRIVGIISHVEELKERIPSSLTIHKDSEKGSQISSILN